MNLYVPLSASPPLPCRPADSESEHSLSVFLSPAGQSFDEDAAERKPVQHSAAASRPEGHARMSAGGNNGGETGHCNGVKGHR